MQREVWVGDTLLRTEDDLPVCGVDHCDTCGDCLACYGDCPCCEGGTHRWVAHMSTIPQRLGDLPIHLSQIVVKRLYGDLILYDDELAVTGFHATYEASWQGTSDYAAVSLAGIDQHEFIRVNGNSLIIVDLRLEIVAHYIEPDAYLVRRVETPAPTSIDEIEF